MLLSPASHLEDQWIGHGGMTGESDEALVALAKAGDGRAFRALVERHHAAIHRFAWRNCGDATEAEDVAQEVLVRVARSIDRFEGRSSFTSWCFGIALNVGRDRHRARSRHDRAVREATALALAEGADAEIAGECDDGALELWAAVDALPERQREAVLLVHVEGLSHREAAAALGCAEATVSWHLFAARRKLKTVLSRSAA